MFVSILSSCIFIATLSAQVQRRIHGWQGLNILSCPFDAWVWSCFEIDRKSKRCKWDVWKL